ncbi:Dual-specificity kinase [Bertholletia excelsa]
MHGWLQITGVVGIASGVLFLVLLVLRRLFRLSKQSRDPGDPSRARLPETPQPGSAKLPRHLDLDHRRRGNYYVFRHELASSKPLFSWADHPSLVTDAVENGWSQFAFAANSYRVSPSTRSTRSVLLGSCAAGDHGSEPDVETSWEVCQGSPDFMQKIRLHPGLNKIHLGYSAVTASSVIRTALPLPGPPLMSSSFPQEAYFEITVLSSEKDNHDPFGRKRSKIEGEKTKLIQENSDTKSNSESLVHVRSSHGSRKTEELKLGVRDDVISLSVGLTRGGSLPLKLPGSYPGSIGFNSDGSVYLDGIKLVFKSEKGEWGKAEKVVGCGYNPNQKKVFFTVDSQLVHVINCRREEFGTPLYPTVAANLDTEVLVNFGQSSFKYNPANQHRTPNPCFIGPLGNSPSLGYDDSKELFSMGRIDAQWLNRCTTRTGHNSNKTLDFDVESEGDLFEIVLDSSGRSPNTVLQ